MTVDEHWDVVVGSGFGGSVSALRLAEEGDRVRMVVQGRRFRSPDFHRDDRARDGRDPACVTCSPPEAR